MRVSTVILQLNSHTARMALRREQSCLLRSRRGGKDPVK